MDLTTWKDLAPLLAVFSPIVALLLSALWFNRSLEKLKSRLQITQVIVQKRAEIYTEMQEPLNEIYCYIKRVGKWKITTPEQVLAHKRFVDQKMHATRPFWSMGMQAAYKEFMDVCFVTNRGHKINAGIVAEVVKYQELNSWKDEFIGYYDGSFDESRLDQVNDKLMVALSNDFGVG
ncbi:MAG: hypothetical protein ACKVI8_20150 [Paraglaciecola sp.]|uniref:DUF4760 domain-containing protein n=1 Tax=Paraglaciecola agarilytica NO2 TaxID=1125747 RepID=A0ABQ0I0M5_9ALTE|nr:hypothetical protein [Paraglaciecola agarilytica]GAC02871.1 hypothetical protein GAGA_0006 [Paraglaciecola agarilytica NO2]